MISSDPVLEATASAADKMYLTASNLLQDTFRLAAKIRRSGVTPNSIVGIWCGGTPVGIAIQEYFEFVDVETDHLAVHELAGLWMQEIETGKIELKPIFDLLKAPRDA